MLYCLKQKKYRSDEVRYIPSVLLDSTIGSGREYKTLRIKPVIILIQTLEFNELPRYW